MYDDWWPPWDHRRGVGLERAVPLGRFHVSYLGSKQRISSELGVSVFVFVWVLCVCGLSV